MSHEADEILLASLLSLGFPLEASKNALIICGNKGVEEAIDIITSEQMMAEPEPPKKPNPPSKSNPEPAKPDTVLIKTKPPAPKSEYDSILSLDDLRAKKPKPPKAEISDDEDVTLSDNDVEEMSEDDEEMDPFANQADLDYQAREIEVVEKTSMKIDQAYAILREQINTLSTTFDIPESAVLAILKFYGWENEVATEKLSEDVDKVLKAVGLPKQQSITKVKDIGHECLICASPFEGKATKEMNCGHTFCMSCWQGYLQQHIKDGRCLDIPCMYYKCPCKVPLDLIQTMVDPDTWNKCTKFLVYSFIDQHPLFRWCPNKGCTLILHAETRRDWDVACSCGFKLCFMCSKESHAPASCDMMTKWDKKCKDDSETSNWIVVNTKDCPKCRSAIEKNGGCNHMTCYKCRYEFCWICNGDWKNHSNCNKFKEDADKKDNSRASLERYLHYFHRYQTHEQSKKFETQLRESAVAKMIAIREDNDINPEYLDQSTEQLIECRRVLKYTYVYAFYLPDGAEKSFFEWLQGDLERDTEELSGLLENQNAWLNRKKVQDYTQKARKRLVGLLEGVQNGLVEVKAKQPPPPETKSKNRFW